MGKVEEGLTGELMNPTFSSSYSSSFQRHITQVFHDFQGAADHLVRFDEHIGVELLAHLKRLRFVNGTNGYLKPPSTSKRRIRAMHRVQRNERLLLEREFVKTQWPTLKKYFADGEGVDPQQISPRLELIEGDTWQSRLFRLAALTWSVPVSQGYGRRMRFLVWDDHNGKLIGLMALGDPVFNLKVRDETIGWTVEDREKRLVNILDAYVLGAVPPYNMLLAGKMVACLVRTREVRDAFARRYAVAKGIISGRRKHASLVLVTTSSALGRSSIYNRLVLGTRRYFEPLGYTSGWGHFHIPQDLFEVIRNFLSAHDHKYANNYRFGDGPNWRLRAVKQALSLLGLSPNLLHHGVNREVFACYLASNALSILKGTAKQPRYGGLQTVAKVSELARQRWIEPRAIRRPEFRLWRVEQLKRKLNPQTGK